MRKFSLIGSLIAVTALAGCATTGTDNSGGLTQRSGGSLDPNYATGSVESAPEKTAKTVSLEQTHRRAAEIAIEENKPLAAITHLAKVREFSPRDREIAYQLSRHLRMVGKFSAAESVVNDARVAHPTDQLLRLELAKIRIGQNRTTEALPILKELTVERPKDPSVLMIYGVAKTATGDSAGARRIFDQALALGRPSAALLNNAAMNALQTGDAPRAVTILQKATAAPGATERVSNNLALALVLADREDEARRILQSSKKEDRVNAMIAAFRKVKKDPNQIGAAWSLAATAN